MQVHTHRKLNCKHKCSQMHLIHTYTHTFIHTHTHTSDQCHRRDIETVTEPQRTLIRQQNTEPAAPLLFSPESHESSTAAFQSIWRKSIRKFTAWNLDIITHTHTH